MAINEIANVNRAVSDENILHINNRQKALVNLGKQQIADGDYVTNEALEKDEDIWLNE